MEQLSVGLGLLLSMVSTQRGWGSSCGVGVLCLSDSLFPRASGCYGWDRGLCVEDKHPPELRRETKAAFSLHFYLCFQERCFSALDAH